MTLHCLRVWLFIISLSLLAVSAVIYFKNAHFLSKLYNGNGKLGALSSRLIATISMLMSLLAGHCAYEVHNKRFYSLCIWGFLLMLVHFVSEMTFFSTIRPSLYSITTIVCLGLTVGWMVFAYPRYVERTKHAAMESLRSSHSRQNLSKAGRHRE